MVGMAAPAEQHRLRVLREYAILDTPREKVFDDLVALASVLCGTPMAVLTLVDERRQWFKAAVGITIGESDRSVAFCAHTIGQTRPMIVADAAVDPRFADNPFVTGEPHIRFYAGVPLVSAAGPVLGALAVIDREPRALTPVQLQGLEALARQAMTHLEGRREVARLSAALESITDAIVAMDRQWRFTYLNAPAEALLQRSREELIGRSIWEEFPSALGTRFETEYRRAFAEGVTVVFEEYYEPLRTWFEVKAYPSASGLTVYFHDINEAHAVREKIRTSEERFRLLARATNDAIWDWDLRTDALWWNDGLTTLFGFRPEEVHPFIGWWTDHIHPADRASVVAEVDRAIRSGGSSWSGEYRFARHDGTYAYVLDRGYILRNDNGEAVRMIGGMSDLSARRSAEERMEQQAALLDQASDAILVRDLEQRILFWNRGAEKIYGWSATEVLGRSVASVLYTDTTPLQLAVETVLQRGEWSGELQHKTKAGGLVMVFGRWTLMRDRDGRPKSILAINTDITERKRLEAQFLRAQRMESIGTLAGGIAHDLNNLLAPIVMGVGLLKSYAPGEPAQRVIGNIERSARRGTDLVKQVLSFARGVEGARVSLDVRAIVDEIEAIVANTFPKTVTFVRSASGPTWPVLGDATQINQILLNLCVNARDAMPAGGRLTIGLANLTIDESLAVMHRGVTPGRYVVIEVTDEGSGMSPEVQERLFEPFFTTKEHGKGTGLGLSTVLGIVRSHGGFVTVQSEIGRGSTFKVHLPAPPAGDVPAPEATASTDTSSLRGRGELVLVVDDEASILTITRQTLEAYGYRVLVAEDGAQAIGVFATHRDEIAVVVTDMMMPVMDGPALVGALRRIRPEVPVIAVSGMANRAQTGRAMELGLRHFLAKPFSAESLLRLLAEALAGP